MATMTAPPSRPPFEPDGASPRATEVLDQASPTQASTALARFEFEAGRGNNGTKILMVEWEDSAHTRRTPGQWHVSWEKKASTALPAKDQLRHGVHRLYFLLMPGVTIPPVVTLTHQPSSSSSSSSSKEQQPAQDGKPTVWQINPLPAIFPPELGASARAHGKKGVLHTLWAKKRLVELQREIEVETAKNVEGVALEMALQEKQWIEQNFGIVARPTAGLNMPAGTMAAGGTEDGATSPMSPTGPTSPKTPGGSSRLAEKLKGLRVGTSERELSGRQGPNMISAGGRDDSAILISPDTSDVAISSFSALHGYGQAPSTQHQHQQQQQGIKPTTTLDPSGETDKAKSKPNHSRHQSSSSSSNNNNNTAADKARPPTTTSTTTTTTDEEDGLFAVAMSPRSPDMAKSPFSSLSTTNWGTVARSTS